MEKYRLHFIDCKGRKYFIDCETMAEVKAVKTEEKAEGSTYIKTEDTKKRSVFGSIAFLLIGLIAMLTDGNICVFAMCSLFSWLTLTADLKKAVSRILRLEV